MALGFWKQRALSADFSENANDSFKLTRKSSPLHGNDRPSSGDSGISECPLLEKCLSSAQVKCGDTSRTLIKMEPEEAVDQTSEDSSLDSLPLKTLNARIQDKENAKPQQRQRKNCSRKTTAKDAATIFDQQQRKDIKLEPTTETEIVTNGTESLRTRRIEANARERSRVHTIGAAFEALRQTVPSNCDQQKLSKLAILRIATAYIRALSSLLEENTKEFALGVEQCTQALLLDGVRSKYPKSVS